MGIGPAPPGRGLSTTGEDSTGVDASGVALGNATGVGEVGSSVLLAGGQPRLTRQATPRRAFATSERTLA